MTPQMMNGISDWLIESALVDRPICETIISFASKLQDAGLVVDRINCSTFQRHQIMGAVDTTWENETGHCQTEFVPKSVVYNPEVIQNPVGAMSRGTSDFERYDLADPVEWSRFPLFEELFKRGYSDYVIFKQSYGRRLDWADTSSDSEGVYGTFATKRDNGFSQAQIAGIKSIWRPFSLFLKSASERMLSAKLLEAYLGSLPAQYILDGMTERGDGNPISCALWYSDLRGSTRLSVELQAGDYLELLNNYFDCTAGSVMAYGGDVLKLIGDAVMAIFPFEPDGASKACLSALSAARDSLDRAARLKNEKAWGPASDLYFGIGLHVGEVILGNVGTTQRLDMTVTGSSANQVTRLEGLTKPLSLSVLASPQFYASCNENLVSVGKYPVPDLGGMTEIYSLVER